jgi:SNF2 family DNA or RNA helicase
VWPQEIKKHTTSDTNIRAIPLEKGSVKERTKLMKMQLKKAEMRNQQAVVIVNYEVVYRDPLKSAFYNANFDLIVADESHRIKSPGGKQSLACYRLSKKVPFKIALTGTPMPHSPMDIYAQYRFLDPAIYGRSFNRFKNRYGIYGGYGGYELLGYQNQEEMNKKFHSIAYKCDSDDVQDLPKEIDINRTAKLSNKAMKKYKELSSLYYTQFQSGEELTALNALSKLLRLQQLTSGYLPDDEGRIHTLDTSKQDLLDDIMKDLKPDEPIVIFA